MVENGPLTQAIKRIRIEPALRPESNDRLPSFSCVIPILLVQLSFVTQPDFKSYSKNTQRNAPEELDVARRSAFCR
jgi:hypothetical protein